MIVTIGRIGFQAVANGYIQHPGNARGGPHLPSPNEKFARFILDDTRKQIFSDLQTNEEFQKSLKQYPDARSFSAGLFFKEYHEKDYYFWIEEIDIDAPSKKDDLPVVLSPPYIWKISIDRSADPNGTTTTMKDGQLIRYSEKWKVSKLEVGTLEKKERDTLSELRDMCILRISQVLERQAEKKSN